MSCICIVFFLLFTLVFSLLATLSATVCDYHVLALQQAPTLNISLGTNNVCLCLNTHRLSHTGGISHTHRFECGQVVFDSNTIESVLNCPSGLNATDDNNFISILGLHELFNVSKQVNQRDSTSHSCLADACSPLTQVRGGSELCC